MEKYIKPSAYNGSITIPGSKSYMQRAVALALLSENKTLLLKPDFSNDSKAAMQVAESLGAQVLISENQVAIKPGVHPINKNLFVGESGLGMRMFTPVSAIFDSEITLSGSGSLLTRPMQLVEQPLTQLGVQVNLNNGYIPVKVKGPIKGGIAKVDGSISSQFLTGLLIALPMAKSDSQLLVSDLKSIPYVKMTLDLVKQFGGHITHTPDFTEFNVKGNTRYKGGTYTVEGDWSSASFHLVGAAIAGKVEVSGLNPLSHQADKAILDALMQCGAYVSIGYESITVARKNLWGFKFDATDCPDLFPPLAALAANCDGVSVITGISRLAHKESNRALTIQDELGKLGIRVELLDDEMIIYGGKISGGQTQSHHDHRIAMMLAVAALNASEPVEITDAEAIGKSYPDFYTHFELLQVF